MNTRHTVFHRRGDTLRFPKLAQPLRNTCVPLDWTCPFCSLLCDGFGLDGDRLVGSDCPRAHAGLAAFTPPVPPQACVDGASVTDDAALAEAARRLARWRQPFFGGLGTDAAGARALFRLAARTGATCDHAAGEALMHGTRALQDRGQFYTTLAEVRARADLVVCVGTQAIAHYPEFFRRCGFDRADTPCRRLVFLGIDPPAPLPQGVPALHIPGTGDPFAGLQQLAALVGAAGVRDPDPQLAALAQSLREARYAVLVWESAMLPTHGALWVELLNRIVATLNADTRAATFALGGSDGAYAVQQAFAWLSGLPLRTRLRDEGPEHEPVRFAGDRLIRDGAVDGLLWTWSFSPDRLPPTRELPCIVLGPPAMAPRLREAGAAANCVFLPVATPGLDAPGHLFRTDGVVVPLRAVREAGPPSVAQVVEQLAQRLRVTA